MMPLVDLHCHLLAGLDDGPSTDEDALAMCRMACAEGVQSASALAHQNERWAEVTPERIREAARRLAEMLRAAGIPLTVFPSAEVMVRPELEGSWLAGDLLSVADRGQFLLVEMPNGLFVDLRETVRKLRRAGVRPILAHPERQPELLHEPGLIEDLVGAGCLVQVSSGSVTDPGSRRDEQELKGWFKRGLVHFMGSDGHSPRSRKPRMAEAYRRVGRWAGSNVADRVFSTNAVAVIHGLPLRVPAAQPRPKRWFARFW